MTTDGLYWLFSTTAQAITAFLALLLTAFALILTLMDSALRRDETLVDIHASLRKRHYLGVKFVSVLLMGASVLSMAIIALRAWNIELPDYVHFIVFCLAVASLVAGIWFVTWIVDPSKYEKAARRLLDDYPQSSKLPRDSDVGAFMATFIEIEALLRNIVRDILHQHNNQSNIPFLSIPALIDILIMNDVIDPDFANELLGLNKYRNLVAHGEIPNVDNQMFDIAKLALQRITEIRVQ